MRAYQRALDCVIRAPADEIAAYEAEAGLFPGIDRHVLVHTIEAYQQLGCWQPNPGIPKADYDKLLDVFLFSGAISQRYAYDSVIVNGAGGADTIA